MKIKKRHVQMARAADRLMLWQECTRQWAKWLAIRRWHRAAKGKHQ